MRSSRAVALSRLSAPSVTLLHAAEVKKLRQVQPWLRWLFVELVIGSDFKNGRGLTSWARVLSLLDFDRPPTGRDPAGAVSLMQARRGLDELEGLGLVRRDKASNEGQGALAYRVPPRVKRSSPRAESDRGSDRVPTGRKASNGAGSSLSSPQNSTGVPTGGSVIQGHTPLPPPEPVDAARREQAQQALRAVADRLRRGESRPRRG
jgi:hypothetical protein